MNLLAISFSIYLIFNLLHKRLEMKKIVNIV